MLTIFKYLEDHHVEEALVIRGTAFCWTGYATVLRAKIVELTPEFTPWLLMGYAGYLACQRLHFPHL